MQWQEYKLKRTGSPYPVRFTGRLLCYAPLKLALDDALAMTWHELSLYETQRGAMLLHVEVAHDKGDTVEHTSEVHWIMRPIALQSWLDSHATTDQYRRAAQELLAKLRKESTMHESMTTRQIIATLALAAIGGALWALTWHAVPLAWSAACFGVLWFDYHGRRALDPAQTLDPIHFQPTVRAQP